MYEYKIIKYRISNDEIQHQNVMLLWQCIYLHKHLVDKRCAVTFQSFFEQSIKGQRAEYFRDVRVQASKQTHSNQTIMTVLWTPSWIPLSLSTAHSAGDFSFA